ncbi:MAG: hypothetical protein KAY55_00150 [Deltaproteobacteria bacterium]|jgi:hypothetical protein|nr:hypothetical protein [Deltaproteobacteria bacterium]
MKRALFLFLLCFGATALSACTDTPDPCSGHPRACIGVTVDGGPPSTYQLLVRVLDGYGSITPLTPRKVPQQPLTFPLRFAIRFDEFDRQHRGTVAFEITALDERGDTVGQVQRSVAIHYTEKVALSLSIGEPFDMTVPEDLRPLPPDLAMPDLASPSYDMLSDGMRPDGGPI